MPLRPRPLILVAMLAAAPLVGAQEPFPPKTRVEAFLAAKGRMVIKDVYRIGRVKGLTLEVVALSEGGASPRRIKGARVEITESGSRPTTHASFLDQDEVQGLSAAAALMEQTMEEWRGQRREPYSEVVFQSNDDFKLGFVQDGPGPDQKVFASSGIFGKADLLGGPEDLSRIRELLRLAVAKLGTLEGSR